MSKSKEVLQQAKPWRRDANWWVLLVEGAVAAAIGLYTVLAPDVAGSSLIYLLGVLLLVDGVMTAVRGIRRKRQRRLNFVRSGVALLGGLLVVVMPLFGGFDALISTWIVGMTFLVLGILRVVGFFVERRDHVRFAEVVIALTMLGIGGWLIYRLLTGTVSASSLVPLGWLLLVLGGFLIAYAFFVRSQRDSDDGEPAAAPAPVKAAAPAPAPEPPAAAQPPAEQPPAGN